MRDRGKAKKEPLRRSPRFEGSGDRGGSRDGQACLAWTMPSLDSGLCLRVRGRDWPRVFVHVCLTLICTTSGRNIPKLWYTLDHPSPWQYSRGDALPAVSAILIHSMWMHGQDQLPASRTVIWNITASMLVVRARARRGRGGPGRVASAKVVGVLPSAMPPLLTSKAAVIFAVSRVDPIRPTKTEVFLRLRHDQPRLD